MLIIAMNGLARYRSQEKGQNRIDGRTGLSRADLY